MLLLLLGVWTVGANGEQISTVLISYQISKTTEAEMLQIAKRKSDWIFGYETVLILQISLLLWEQSGLLPEICLGFN